MAYADEKVFHWINGLAGRVSFFDRIIEWVVSDYMIPVALALVLVGLWFAGSDMLTRQRYQIGLFVALTSHGLVQPGRVHNQLAVFQAEALR